MWLVPSDGERADVGENVVGVGGNVGDFVDLGHDAIGCDQKRQAPGVVRILLVGPAFDAVGPADGAVDVAEQREPESVLFGEDEILRRGIEARAEDLGARLVELWASVTEALPFTRSAARRCLREPPQDDPGTAQVAQTHRTAVFVGECEIRSESTDIDHGGSIRG